MDNYNYPLGADTPDAPWNQVDPEPREIEVTVSITLSKTIKVTVDDYEVTESGKDEDGFYYEDIDYSNCDLKNVVEEQIVLPHNMAGFTKKIFDADLDLKAAGMPRYFKEAIKDCEGWNVDDFEVIPE